MKDIIHVKGIVSKDEEDFWIITDEKGQVHDAGDLLSGIDLMMDFCTVVGDEVEFFVRRNNKGGI